MDGRLIRVPVGLPGEARKMSLIWRLEDRVSKIW
jgi:hypothetical protein